MTTLTTPTSLCQNTNTSPFITGILLITPLHQIIITAFQKQYPTALTDVLALSAVAVISKSMGCMQSVLQTLGFFDFVVIRTVLIACSASYFQHWPKEKETYITSVCYLHWLYISCKIPHKHEEKKLPTLRSHLGKQDY